MSTGTRNLRLARRWHRRQIAICRLALVIACVQEPKRWREYREECRVDVEFRRNKIRAIDALEVLVKRSENGS